MEGREKGKKEKEGGKEGKEEGQKEDAEEERKEERKCDHFCLRSVSAIIDLGRKRPGFKSRLCRPSSHALRQVHSLHTPHAPVCEMGA